MKLHRVRTKTLLVGTALVLGVLGLLLFVFGQVVNITTCGLPSYPSRAIVFRGYPIWSGPAWYLCEDGVSVDYTLNYVGILTLAGACVLVLSARRISSVRGKVRGAESPSRQSSGEMQQVQRLPKLTSERDTFERVKYASGPEYLRARGFPGHSRAFLESIRLFQSWLVSSRGPSSASVSREDTCRLCS